MTEVKIYLMRQKKIIDLLTVLISRTATDREKSTDTYERGYLRGQENAYRSMIAILKQPQP